MAETHHMTITRTFDAPLEQVWNAWSDSELVKQWWGPRGFTAPLAEMDFREGGTSLVCMRAPAEFGGQDIYNTWAYTRILPMQEIEFIQRFTDANRNPLEPSAIGLPDGIPAEVRHVLTFSPKGENQTELTVTEYGYGNAEVSELSKMGLGQCLDKMAESLS